MSLGKIFSSTQKLGPGAYYKIARKGWKIARKKYGNGKKGQKLLNILSVMK